MAAEGRRAALHNGASRPADGGGARLLALKVLVVGLTCALVVQTARTLGASTGVVALVFPVMAWGPPSVPPPTAAAAEPDAPAASPAPGPVGRPGRPGRRPPGR